MNITESNVDELKSAIKAAIIKFESDTHSVIKKDSILIVRDDMNSEWARRKDVQWVQFEIHA